MPRKPKDRRRKGKGWQAYVRVNGTLHTQQFDLADHPAKIDAWVALQRRESARRVRGTLAGDVAAFLARPEIAAQPYVHQTAQRLACWVDALDGERPRASIDRAEIEAVIQRWLRQYAEPTVYHRRSALLSLYTVLDGAGAANPVKETSCPKAWIPGDHSVPFQKLKAIVDAMPEWAYPKKGIKRPAIAKLVGRVVLHVGIRPADLARIRRPDIDWQAATVRWPASTKGRGVSARTVPLSDEGLLAFRAFDAANAYGTFNPEAVSHSFKRAARKIDGAHTAVHLYSSRHTLGADLYRETRDLATVGRMLNHVAGSRATAQYAQGANADVDRAAVASLSAARQVQATAPKLPKTLPATKKRRVLNTLRKRS